MTGTNFELLTAAVEILPGTPHTPKPALSNVDPLVRSAIAASASLYSLLVPRDTCGPIALSARALPPAVCELRARIGEDVVDAIARGRFVGRKLPRAWKGVVVRAVAVAAVNARLLPATRSNAPLLLLALLVTIMIGGRRRPYRKDKHPSKDTFGTISQGKEAPGSLRW